MSDETDSQLEDTLVTWVLEVGVTVVRGLTPSAAKTSVTADCGLSRRSYQLTFRLPWASTFRSAGKKCKLPTIPSLSSFTGEACTRESVPRLKLCSRMSPSGFLRASFQTMLTVLFTS